MTLKEKWMKILDERIKNSSKFYLGQSIYLNNKVQNITIKEHNNDLIISADVKGSHNNSYSTSVVIHSRSNNASNYCTCPDNLNKPSRYFCKHAVAVCFGALNYFANTVEEEEKYISEGEFLNLIANYDAKQPSIIKPKKINFEYELKENSDYHFDGYSLGIRAGIDKLYVVKRIDDLLKTYKDIQEECTLTKDIDYNNKDYIISDEDKKIFDFLFKIFLTNHYNFYNNRFVEIPITDLKELYELFNGLNVKYAIEKYQLIYDNPPIQFLVDETKEGFVLDLNKKALMEGYNGEANIVLYDDNCYLIDNDFKRLVIPLFEILNQKKGSFIIPYEYKEILFKQFLPLFIYSDKNVLKLHENIESKIAIPELNIKLYIDKEGKSAVLDLVFEYTNGNQEKYILKNINREDEIKNLIFNVNVIEENNKYYIDKIEEIFTFADEIIPLLQEEKVEIFYSEEFKKMINRTKFNFTTSVHFDNGLLSMDFEYDDVDISELKGIFNSIQVRKKYYQLKNGNIIKINNEEAIEWGNLINDLEISDKEINSDKYSFNKYEALYLDNVFKKIDDKKVKIADEFQYLVDNIKNTEQLNFDLPREINAKLRDYQVKGYRWLKTLNYFGFGGILADDMGLGKTLQVITLMQDLKEQKENSKSLVVAPASVIYNWEAEIKKFAPNLKYIILAESKLIREKHFENLDDYDVIVTSYPLIRRDIDKYETYHFDFCFLDEAQYIKNLYSSSANACKQIQADGRFAVTGTPLENSVSELWSIFDFIMPGYLKSYHYFRKHYERPIINDNNEEVLKKLFNKVKPFILRREKSAVAPELPDKVEKNIYISLEGEQEKVYLAHFLQAKKEISTEISANGYNRSQIKILAILTRLRQICCDPNLFMNNFKGESAKLEYLMQLLNEKTKNGNRILLFSQFTSMLDIIEDKLEKNSFFRIDGSIKTKDRMDMVNRFNMGEKKFFLISLKAGGTGLNLVGADTVIHFDPWWNPAVEDQATDRAYRIGQENKVQVYKLITKNTIEERINELKDKKREVADSLIKTGETFINKLSEEELVSILSE